MRPNECPIISIKMHTVCFQAYYDNMCSFVGAWRTYTLPAFTSTIANHIEVSSDITRQDPYLLSFRPSVGIDVNMNKKYINKVLVHSALPGFPTQSDLLAALSHGELWTSSFNTIRVKVIATAGSGGAVVAVCRMLSADQCADVPATQQSTSQLAQRSPPPSPPPPRRPSPPPRRTARQQPPRAPRPPRPPLPPSQPDPPEEPLASQEQHAPDTLVQQNEPLRCNLNGMCERWEDYNSCSDCSCSAAMCGDMICDIARGENCANCPMDCYSAKVGRDLFCCGGAAEGRGCGHSECSRERYCRSTCR